MEGSVEYVVANGREAIDVDFTWGGFVCGGFACGDLACGDFTCGDFAEIVEIRSFCIRTLDVLLLDYRGIA